MTAAITGDGSWPCAEGSAPSGSVIILSAEDGAGDTIVPRLMAAGADLDRVHIVSAVRNPDGKGQRGFNLQTDVGLLERKIAEVEDVALVIIDPVSSYLGSTDSHKNSEVRGVLEPLSDMAERSRVAVLSITHFSKTNSNSSTKALHRFIGSIAFTGAPRTAFAKLNIEVTREGFGPGSKVLWRHRCPPGPIGAHTFNVNTYGENEHLCSDGLDIPVFLRRNQ